MALCLHVTPAPRRLPDPGFLPSLSELPGPPRSSTTVFLACLQRQSSTFVCGSQRASTSHAGSGAAGSHLGSSVEVVGQGK